MDLWKFAAIRLRCSRWPDEIDVHRAEEAKLRAERRIGSGEKQVDMVRAELALKKALTRINLVSTLGK